MNGNETGTRHGAQAPASVRAACDSQQPTSRSQHSHHERGPGETNEVMKHIHEEVKHSHEAVKHSHAAVKQSEEAAEHSRIARQQEERSQQLRQQPHSARIERPSHCTACPVHVRLVQEASTADQHMPARQHAKTRVLSAGRPHGVRPSSLHVPSDPYPPSPSPPPRRSQTQCNKSPSASLCSSLAACTHPRCDQT